MLHEEEVVHLREAVLPVLLQLLLVLSPLDRAFMVEACLQLPLLTHQALNLASLLMLLERNLVTLISQTLHLLLILLVVLSLAHPQILIVHSFLMHLLGILVVIGVFEIKYLFGLALGILNFFECPILFSFQHFNTVT